MITSLNRIDEHSGAGVLAAKTIKLPVGKYKSVQMDFILDAAAAQNIAATDLGQIEVLHENRSLGTVRIATLQSIANIVGGVAEATIGAAGAAHTFSVCRWFGLPKDEDNCLVVDKDNQTFIRWTPAGTLAALLDAAVNQSLITYAEPSNGAEKYILKIEEDDYILGAGNPVVEGLFSKENIYWLFMENNTNITRVTVSVDGESTVDVDRLAINRYTHRVFELETYSATLNPILLLNNTTKDLEASLVDKVKVIPSLTAGDTISFTTFSLDYDERALRNSIASREAQIAASTQRKTALGKTRPVGAIQTLKMSMSGR